MKEQLRDLVSVFRSRVERPRRLLLGAAAALVVVIALLVARGGTGPARLGALGILVVLALVLVAFRLVGRTRFRDEARAIRQIAGRVAPAEASRAVRALGLAAASSSGESEELVSLHIERALQALPRTRIEDEGIRQGRWLRRGAWLFGLAAMATCGVQPVRVFEGANVAVARKGLAPVPIIYLWEPTLKSRPPEYLHAPERTLPPFTAFEAPQGALLTLRAGTMHDGRALALSDGSHEIPFVDDGDGRIVARWPLQSDVTLKVVARFGDVRIEEPREIKVHSIPDAAPVVVLEDAPRRVSLVDGLPDGELPVRYIATDDHGLREVHLVLRSAGREERRVLARLDGETRTDRGGYMLRVGDPFLKKSHAPIEVRVEAKDNDPITGPKWGASEAITLVPPAIGEPEAKRVAALRPLRDLLVDGLARLVSDEGSRLERTRENDKLLARVQEELTHTHEASFAGIRMASRLVVLLGAQQAKLRAALRSDDGKSDAKGGAAEATARFALVVDSMMSGLSFRDARSVAKKLADVADDLVLGVGQLSRAATSSTLSREASIPTGGASATPRATGPGNAVAEPAGPMLRIAVATDVLKGGGGWLFGLGSLGRDLGEITESYLKRVERGLTAKDYAHAELAARDLAVRLRQPDPSFGSKGGRGGGEAGSGSGMPSEGEGQGQGQGDASDAEEAFAEAAAELDKLVAEHGKQLGETEQALASPPSDDDVAPMTEELKKHAESIRKAAKDLPNMGAGSDSWAQRAATGKEHATQMAKELENGKLGEATQDGRNALQQLDEARQRLERERWFGGNPSEERRVTEARKKLADELAWAEQASKELRKKSSQAAKPQLREQGDREDGLADRIGKLQRNVGPDGAPQAATDALKQAEQRAKDAARALRAGDGERAAEEQRQAQKQLERARSALGDKDDDGRGDPNSKKPQPEGDDGNSVDGHADIPKADAHKGPEEFRRRVLKGLGQGAQGRNADAVRRYAEGLVK